MKVNLTHYGQAEVHVFLVDFVISSYIECIEQTNKSSTVIATQKHRSHFSIFITDEGIITESSNII